MDDQRFDNIIKEKVGEYEEPGFDPSGLSALHQQMAATNVWPWYSRYRNELLIAAGMALCTLIIVWSQWYFSQQQNNFSIANAAEADSQKEQIKNLLHEITILRNLPPDTIRITELKQDRPSPNSLLLIQRIASLEKTVRKLQRDLETYQIATQGNESDMYTARNLISTSGRKGNDYTSFHSSRVVPKLKEKASSLADSKNVINPERNIKRALSTKTLRDLEKHYRKGIGIRIGPTMEFSRGLYDAGTSKIDFAGGALGDFIFSPSLSLETGAKFYHRFYEIPKEDLAGRPLPNIDNTMGPLVYADVDSWILEVPLNLKYRHPFNPKTNWVGGIGYSSLLYTRQVFEYDYAVDGNPAARLNTSTSINQTRLYPGTLNISLGLGHQVKNNKILETSLFYQHGFGKMGVEKTKADFFGMRATYWFILR